MSGVIVLTGLASLQLLHVNADFSRVDAMVKNLLSDGNNVMRNMVNATGRKMVIQPKYDYGCYCRYIAEMSYFPVNGEPVKEVIGAQGVDAIDKLCKRLLNGWACLANDGCDINAQDYVAPGFFGFLEPSIYMEECEDLNAGNQFAVDLCKVEVWFAAGFFDAFFQNPTDVSYQEDPTFDLEGFCKPWIGRPGLNRKWVRCCDARDYPHRSANSVLASEGC